jgi:hypothetical protein
MKTALFKKAGWVYVPTSIIGFVITAFILAVFLHDFIFIDSRAHSISDTYYNFSPYGFMYAVIYMWIAKNTAGQ